MIQALHIKNNQSITSAIRTISGGFSLVIAFGISFYGVLTGESLVYSQIVTSVFGDYLWPLTAGIALGGAIIGTMFLLMVSLGIFARVAPPNLFGWDEYEIIGVGGLLGTAGAVLTSAATRIIGLPVFGDLQPTGSGESLIVLGVVAVPFVYVFHELYRPSLTSVDITRRCSHTYDPEFVRDKTAQWSTSKPDTSIQRNPRESSPSTKDQNAGNREIQSDRNSKPDYSDLEFHWITKTDVAFNDVGGLDDLKRELEREVIKPLTTHREQADQLGISAPNIIFHGPPGTGKTYLARALATELSLPYVQLSGADVQSKWINESAQKVQTLFEEAKIVAKQDGGAVIFLDELDSVLKNREGGGNTHEEDNKVVNEFLNHLESTEKHDIVFIGATNRLESLDEAVIRPGRIDKKIYLGKPDTETRVSILATLLDTRPHVLSQDDIYRAAVETNELTAADLESIVRTAAKYTLERDGKSIKWKDVEKPIQKFR